MIEPSKIIGFDWDDGNVRKNEKHAVTTSESEQVFFNTPLLLLEDTRHSGSELRFHALGMTDEARALHITFTLRDHATKVRVISARDMHRKEREIYEKGA